MPSLQNEPGLVIQNEMSLYRTSVLQKKTLFWWFRRSVYSVLQNLLSKAAAFCAADSVFQELYLSTLAGKDVGTSSARVWFASGFVSV